MTRPSTMTYYDKGRLTGRTDNIGSIIQVSLEREGVVTILADNISHLPSGRLHSLTLGNGTT